MNITKIVIKSCSGYGPVDEAYDDKIILTNSSISYEYIPIIESKMNSKRKWSYKTNSPVFALVFEAIAKTAPTVIFESVIPECTDVGMFDFTITYEDKSKKNVRYSERTIRWHIGKGRLFATLQERKYLVSKYSLIKFLASDKGFAMQPKSEWHEKAIRWFVEVMYK